MKNRPVVAAEGPGRTFVQSIHGLRGLSALLVYFWHVCDISSKYGFFPESALWSIPLLRSGAHGVQIFFLISGFLITGSVIHHADAAQFLIDRCIRIYPVFLLIHLMSFGLGPFLKYKIFAGVTFASWCRLFIENLFFMPGVIRTPPVQTNAWSLSYEALFYLLAALTYVVAKRFGSRTAQVFVFIISLVTLYYLPFCIFFLMGVGVYLWSRKIDLDLPRFLSIPLLLVTLLLLSYGERSSALSYGEENRWMVYGASISGVLMFWSVVKGRCYLSRFLKTRMLTYFGTISYSFYLWHAVVTFPLKFAFAREVGRLGAFWTMVLFGMCGLIGSVVVSHMSYELLEKRVGRALRAKVRSHKSDLTPVRVGV
jgi:peptidoglycan/LPS O-acetylase OafA/YrhL